MFRERIFALSEFAFEPESPGYLQTHSKLLKWYLFGMSGWWSSNAIFSQLPIFVKTLPAGERLGNQLSTTLQLGNVVLITYKVLERFGWHFDVRLVIKSMQIVACAALLACVFLWDKITAGSSVALLVLMGFAGAVGCLSNSVYWAYMISHPKMCTKAASVGMCLSGVVTSMLQAVQMAGTSDGEPRFSVSIYLALAAVLQLVWGLVVVQVEKSSRSRKFLQVRNPWARQMSPGAVGLLQEEAIDDGKREEVGMTLSRSRSSTNDSTDGAWPDNLHVIALNSCDFCLHAGEYSLPTLLPFLAAAYPKVEEQELLVRMMVVQQWGETLGRTASPDVDSRQYHCITGLCIVSMPCIFVLFFVAALRPQLLSSTLTFFVARWALPVLNFWFNFCYGLLQNVLFLRARHLTQSVSVAERLASTMGFVGQMGSLTANLFLCYLINAPT